jgi:hypothetical protein
MGVTITHQFPKGDLWVSLDKALGGIEMKTHSTIDLVLRAVALAMGVAVVVLAILGSASLQTLAILLGLGLFAIALWSFQGPE